jgi:hypothetical protein
MNVPYAKTMRSHLVIPGPVPRNNVFAQQGAQVKIIYSSAKTVHDNLIVRPWLYNKIIAQFFSKSDLTEYVTIMLSPLSQLMMSKLTWH